MIMLLLYLLLGLNLVVIRNKNGRYDSLGIFKYPAMMLGILTGPISYGYLIINICIAYFVLSLRAIFRTIFR